MQINIYKDKMPGACLFGASVLYSAKPIPREDVPQGWYCYDLRGTARHPDEPHALVDLAEENHAGSILSCLPLKKGGSQFRLIKDMFQMTGTNPSLAEFCAEEKIRCPETPIRHQLCPASPEDAGLFYAQTPEKDRKGPPPEPSAAGPVGKGRRNEAGGVFAARRKQNRAEFLLTRWPRGPEELNTQEFRDELDKVVNDLRKGVLKDLPSMRRYCYGSKGAIAGGSCCQNYGFTLETGRYLYRLRCNPIEGDYQCYLSCFDKQAQQMGLTEKGLQALQNAADPTLPHRYEWYVIEHINTPERRIDHDLPLEEAIQLYAGLDCADKGLGVTKDSVAAVDLAIHWDGREWLSEDRLRMDEFKDDPVVAEAAARLRQVLDESPAVGRVTFASGERWNYTDPEKYLQTVREELPCHAATGFRCETLTDDPEVRKAVDDMLCGLYGEENSRTLEDYGNSGMTMGGIS